MTRKIVVIEDDIDAQETYKDLLSKHDYQVHLAPSVHQGFELVYEKSPDVIILDLMIPTLEDGLSAIVTLKTDYRSKLIPIIVVSNRESQREAAILSGATEFIGKASSSVENLLSVIRKYAG